MIEEKEESANERGNDFKEKILEVSSTLATAIQAERIANGEEIEIMTNDGHN